MSLLTTTNKSNPVETTLFPVRKFPMEVVTESGNIKTDYNAILNGNTNEVLYTGKAYEPIENEFIINALDNIKNLKIEKVYNYNNKAFSYELVSTKEIMWGPEKAKFMIRVKNSYDGSTSLSVTGGVYVLVCSNGATSPKFVENFAKKHTKQIGQDEMRGFFTDSIKSLASKSDLFGDKQWSNDTDFVKEKFQEIIKIFPKPKNEDYHNNAILLNSEYISRLEQYPNAREFALWMACTDLTSHYQRYGLTLNYQKKLDQQVSEIFMDW
tara:strand:- start:1541 stop:2344 length:804 start_codon:yes stop_codon:yes gene_type:complete